jgi:asparagine synthase (glutamine-hydrolysing)
MCGICGIVDFRGLSVSKKLLGAMTETLGHRGPDDSGVFVSGPVGMGHARLSIIDLSSSGHQPMLSDDGRYALVYNGEVYNFPELRKNLERRGAIFRGNSDTEIVLKALLEWGTDALAMFKGMFALAFWDKEAERLYAARDRFGIKPLYYHFFDSGIIFGSEVKAILAANKFKREVDFEALHEYLYYGTALGSNFLFKGVKKVLPGNFLVVTRQGCRCEPFFSMEEIPRVSDDLASSAEKIRCYLDGAVKSHLLSDVPVGVFLSGGIDSSTITALASRHYHGTMKTFSVGFDFDRGINELPKAKMVAQHFGTEHHELHIEGKKVSQVIEKLVRCHDAPFGDAANIPLYLLCEQLKGSIKVILQGDGGDEIFAGYRRYNVLAFERVWQALSRAGSVLGRLIPRSPAHYRYMRFFKAMKNSDAAMRMALLMTEESLDSPPTRVLSEEVRGILRSSNPFFRYREIFDCYAHLDPVQRMLYTDCRIILPDIFLGKVDKSTMAHSIEVRVPFLDNDLASYVMGIPSAVKVRFGQKKWLLRYAMRGIVPDTILDGKKTGFSVPYSWWLKEPLANYMKSVMYDKQIMDWGFFDKSSLKKCMDEHISGERNNGFLLYKLLNLALWYKFYMV